MSDSHTLVIRGGQVVDGSGAEPVFADVAVQDGRIVEVGKVSGKGAREIDAAGHLVMPGFIDPHTHYDAQMTWQNRLTPSTTHGVTTLVVGNCGVGFAPCAPADREALMYLMEGVEDIPGEVMREGLPWAWTSFPEFVDFIGSRSYDADVATQVPHSAVRVNVMGERGIDRAPATEDDLRRMRALVAEGLRAGALGFSTSRSGSHRTPDERHVPSYGADEAELTAIAQGLRDAGAGWFQLISDFDDLDAELGMLQRLAERAGRPMTLSLLQKDHKPEQWREILARVAAANAKGLEITAQATTRATGVLLGFELSENVFSSRPSWQAVEALPFERRLEHLRDPAFRRRLCSEQTALDSAGRHNAWKKIYPLGNPVNYEPAPERSIAAIAEREGRAPDLVAYDLMMENNGRGILYRAMSNYSYGNLDAVREMLAHPNTLVGLGDGGAHLGHLCDSSVMSFMLTHWARDRAATRGGTFPIGWAVKRLTRDNAWALGLRDRGQIAPGQRADINIIDHARMQLGVPEVAYDLPGGGKRILQACSGILTTLVCGIPVHWNGEPTGDLPGRLVRGSQAARV